MFARKFQLEFSPRAQRDMDNILSYTLEKWGERQAGVYKSKIDKIISIIIGNPDRGKRFASNMLVALAEKHKIFYRIEAQKIIVIRILHQRMDAGRHLR